MQGIYKEPEQALFLWGKLVERHGLREAEKILVKNSKLIGKLEGMELFFIKDQIHKEAIGKIDKVVKSLVNMEMKRDQLSLKERELKKVDEGIRNKLQGLADLKIEGLSHEEIKMQIRGVVKNTMFKIGSVGSGEVTNKITKRVTEQIVEFKNRYKKEASAEDKISFYIKARYEHEREEFYKGELQKQSKAEMQDLEVVDKVKLLAKIDANLGKKEDGYHVACNPREVLARYDNLQARTIEITKSYMK